MPCASALQDSGSSPHSMMDGALLLSCCCTSVRKYCVAMLSVMPTGAPQTSSSQLYLCSSCVCRCFGCHVVRCCRLSLLYLSRVYAINVLAGTAEPSKIRAGWRQAGRRPPGMGQNSLQAARPYAFGKEGTCSAEASTRRSPPRARNRDARLPLLTASCVFASLRLCLIAFTN